REAKYGHAAEFPTVQARRAQWKFDGMPVYATPVATMVTNFPKPTQDQPSLMPHGQVEVLFHEFGHVIHHCLSQTKFFAQSGTNVAQDFGEAPSQILEYWVWEPEVLKRISKHYQTGEVMPDELIAKLVATKNHGAGLFNSRQMVNATFDHRLYTEEGADPVGLFRELWESILGIDVPAGQMYAAGFTHLMNPGYEGGYYGYMWSKVYAADIFSKFAESGALSPQLGLDYRHKILEVGSSRDELDSVRDFLGRDISNQAFLRELGI
ncbi:MAG: oligopeptidase A, partial [Candidatus Doudnabacteria bacterium]|nr:oligopeptidase A [Candidatus Doudnabacteria bacterium]